MTVAPSVGFPDWQGYAQWGESIIYHQTFDIPAGQYKSISQNNLTAWSAVLLKVFPNSGTGTVNVTVYDPGGDPALGDTYSWPVTYGGPQLAVIIPTRGQAVDVVLGELTGTALFEAIVTMTALNQSVPRATYQANQNIVNLGNQTIPAGGELDGLLPYIDNGTVNINVNNVSAKQISQIQFEVLAVDGTWNVFALLDVNKTEPAFYSLALPGASVRVRLLNSTTTAISGVYLAVWTDSD